ncbi:MAG: cysteine desulfurase, partial [Candidatus Latescibacteria bacterium]|nr:cysteine desulfurase [Candidatus Latescibacterota bacterium]
AILKTAEKLERDGFNVKYIGVDSSCEVDLNALRDAVDESTSLVSIMHANNETGVLQNIEKTAEIAHEVGALFHTDAVQAAGKTPIDVRSMDIDLLSMSGHKLNAPKGVGVLYIKNGVMVSPLTYGGSHERGIRPGTENVAGIVAFAKAFELALKGMEEDGRKISAMRDRLEKSIGEQIPNILFNGRGAPRLPGTSNISIPGVDGEALLFSLDMEGIAASTGSACSSGGVAPSHVLIAMGREPKAAQSSLRFSMGWGSTDEGVDHILNILPPTVERLRKISGEL